jgi:NAD(P)-dependent dehydrogenase (short-subunit alcohol dehydrogenase family)
LVAYVTAKHAQVGPHAHRRQGGPRRGIRVNTLHPGPIDNAFQLKIEDGIGKMAGGVDGTKLLDDMIPLHRHARPEEITRSALYLACDMASFVTAATLMADGGCGDEAWD